MKNKSRDTNEIIIQKIIGYCNDLDVLVKSSTIPMSNMFRI